MFVFSLSLSLFSFFLSFFLSLSLSFSFLFLFLFILLFSFFVSRSLFSFSSSSSFFLSFSFPLSLSLPHKYYKLTAKNSFYSISIVGLSPIEIFTLMYDNVWSYFIWGTAFEKGRAFIWGGAHKSGRNIAPVSTENCRGKPHFFPHKIGGFLKAWLCL